ncbi:MAG: helix-turn-helix transcriptional regulator [Oscillospiraceae bacterium]|nr:helix-turn-helix transcriptional regulator [Oscillospiraceae bacterium]
MQIIGERLRALRKANNLTQIQMAEILEVQQSRINRYETGASTPPAETFIQYADFFDVSMDYLYGRCDEPQGKLYKNQPQILLDRAKHNPEMEQFIEMLFDPSSPASGKVKEALLRIMKEGDST